MRVAARRISRPSSISVLPTVTLRALDEAYEHTRTMLGEARESPVDVVLYTREEFRVLVCGDGGHAAPPRVRVLLTVLAR